MIFSCSHCPWGDFCGYSNISRNKGCTPFKVLYNLTKQSLQPHFSPPVCLFLPTIYSPYQILAQLDFYAKHTFLKPHKN